MTKIKTFIAAFAGAVLLASPASATTANYGPGRSADFSFIGSVDGSGYVEYGTLSSNTALYYRGGNTVPMSSTGQVYFSGGYVVEGNMNGSASVSYGGGSATVQGHISFGGLHYLEIATLYGNQSFAYGSSSHTVPLKGNTEVNFSNNHIVFGTLNATTQLQYMGTADHSIDGYVFIKGNTEVEFSPLSDNLLTRGTIHGTEVVWYIPDQDSLEYVWLADGTEAAFYTPFQWADGAGLSWGTMAYAQNLYYAYDWTGSTPTRSAYLKGYVAFTGTVYAGTSAGSQTLVTSSGTYNASNNENLIFGGGFVIP